MVRCPTTIYYRLLLYIKRIELQTKVRENFTITEKAHIRAFSWLKVLTRASTFKTLSSRKRPFSMIVKTSPINSLHQSLFKSKTHPGGVSRFIMLSSSRQLLMNSSLVTRPSESISIFSNMDLARSLAVSCVGSR